MAEQVPCPYPLDITFSVGTSLLIIAPETFDIRPARDDSGVIYCEIAFTAPWCHGKGRDVFLPEHFRDLALALRRMRNGEPASVSILGLESWFCLEGTWNAEKQVPGFRISIPAFPGPNDPYLWYEASQLRGNMRASIQLHFWLEPAALEELLAEVEAVVEHIRGLWTAFRAQGYTFDAMRKRWI